MVGRRLEEREADGSHVGNRCGAHVETRLQERDQPLRRRTLVRERRGAPARRDERHERRRELPPHAPRLGDDGGACRLAVRRRALDPTPALAGGLEDPIEMDGVDPGGDRAHRVHAVLRRDRQRRIRPRAGRRDRRAGERGMGAGDGERGLEVDRGERQVPDVPGAERPRRRRGAERRREERREPGIVEGPAVERGGGRRGRQRTRRDVLARAHCHEGGQRQGFDPDVNAAPLHGVRLRDGGVADKTGR